MLNDTYRNALLDAVPVPFLSIHTAYSAAGANEVAGGAPAYARKAGTWAAAAAAVKATNGATVAFDIPASSTVRYVGKWSAVTAGTFYGMSALGGVEKEYTVDVTANTIISPAHGFVANDQVVFLGGTVPAPLVEATQYFVVTPTTDNFQVSATSGGAAIDITAANDGKSVVSKIVPETFGAQGALNIAAGNLSISLAA